MATLAQTPALITAYRELLSLSERQRERLEAGDRNGFHEATGLRNTAFLKVQSLEPQAELLDPFSRRTLANLISEVIASDALLDKAMRQRADAIQNELRGLHTGLNVLHSYAVDVERHALFIDRSS